MSVSYDNRRRDSGHEIRAPFPDALARRGVFAAHRQPPRRRPQGAETPPSGLLHPRVEALIQIVLAFALVGGATALIHSSLFAAPPAAAPSAADSVPAAFFDARPIAGRTVEEAEEAPRPLAPPTAEMRDRLAAPASPPGTEESAAVQPMAKEAEPEPTTAATPVREEAGPAGGGRPAKCFVKLSGRVQVNGTCRIRRSDGEVAFQLADRTLTFAHEHGRLWTASMAGRALGKVYQVRRGRCWGSRGSGFYACDNS